MAWAHLLYGRSQCNNCVTQQALKTRHIATMAHGLAPRWQRWYHWFLKGVQGKVAAPLMLRLADKKIKVTLQESVRAIIMRKLRKSFRFIPRHLA